MTYLSSSAVMIHEEATYVHTFTFNFRQEQMKAPFRSAARNMSYMHKAHNLRCVNDKVGCRKQIANQLLSWLIDELVGHKSCRLTQL